MRHISVDTFKEVITQERDNTAIDFINVCTPPEYAEKHIEGVRSVPLDEIASHIETFKNKKAIYVHCRSGNRSQRAIAELKRLGITADLINVDGGLMAWEDAKLPTLSLSKTKLPIMRQMLLIAGTLVLAGVLLGTCVDQRFLLISGFVGVGLTFAGLTGWCGMVYLLGKMPWNK